MSNPYNELHSILEEIPGCTTELMNAWISGSLTGKIGDDNFRITTNKTEFLLISTTAECLNTLRPALDKFMDGNSPICRYDMIMTEGDIRESRQTWEWDIVNPESRIKEIVNGKAYDNTPLENIVLFDRNIEDYTSEAAKQAFDEAEAERIKNARIYGIDMGHLADAEEVRASSEVDFWLNIDSIGHYIWWVKHQAGHGRIEKVDTTEEQYAYEFIVYEACKKLGFEVSTPEVDKHVRPSADYQKWYEFNRKHFKETLTNAEWDEFQKARDLKADISRFLPTGDWREAV